MWPRTATLRHFSWTAFDASSTLLPLFRAACVYGVCGLRETHSFFGHHQRPVECLDVAQKTTISIRDWSAAS
uniref:Putative secreted protein n=1 Tax=Anopheles marajoara TaxID=58244 RepID=A0A2M4CDW1_9DIPT